MTSPTRRSVVAVDNRTPSHDGGRRRLATDAEMSAAGGSVNDIREGVRL